jgi:hypothetical protein
MYRTADGSAPVFDLVSGELGLNLRATMTRADSVGFEPTDSVIARSPQGDEAIQIL